MPWYNGYITILPNLMYTLWYIVSPPQQEDSILRIEPLKSFRDFKYTLQYIVTPLWWGVFLLETVTWPYPCSPALLSNLQQIKN